VAIYELSAPTDRLIWVRAVSASRGQCEYKPEHHQQINDGTIPTAQTKH